MAAERAALGFVFEISLHPESRPCALMVEMIDGTTAFSQLGVDARSYTHFNVLACRSDLLDDIHRGVTHQL